MRDTLIVAVVAVVAVVIGVFFFLYLNCRDFCAPSYPMPKNSSAAVAVPFKTLARGTHSKVATRVNYFITSMAELDKLWKMLDATGTPPTIDFKTHAVAAVFAGQQPTTGYAISVSKVEDSSTRMVSVTLAKPADGCIQGQVITAPYELVALPATSLPLAHKDISTTGSCPK